MNPIDIRTFREALGLSQNAFGAEMGVDQGTVSRWESGRSAMPGPAEKLLIRMLADAGLTALRPSAEQPLEAEPGQGGAEGEPQADGDRVDAGGAQPVKAAAA